MKHSPPRPLIFIGQASVERTELRHGRLCFLVEFACERSMEIYAALVTLGIQLSRNAHLGLTRLCQCARYANCIRCRARIRIIVQAVSLAESPATGAAPRGE